MIPANDLPMAQAPTNQRTTIASPLGLLHLRPEQPQDRDFRFDLFCKSRLPEWDLVPLDPAVRHQLMAMQFEAQTTSYAAQFPQARFDIIELEGKPIGRIVVDRPGDRIHIVDVAIVPELRSRGAGTAIMRALMAEAAAAGLPVRLTVADSNDPSLRLYSRLGFRQIDQAIMYMELEWRAAAGDVAQ
jgi:ribosomal protein S18 acetylase RimI-like enzyme